MLSNKVTAAIDKVNLAVGIDKCVKACVKVAKLANNECYEKIKNRVPFETNKIEHVYEMMDFMGRNAIIGAITGLFKVGYKITRSTDDKMFVLTLVGSCDVAEACYEVIHTFKSIELLYLDWYSEGNSKYNYYSRDARNEFVGVVKRTFEASWSKVK